MSFQTYLNQLQEFNLLSHKEFLSLLKKAQKGNKRARNKIVNHNLRLVVHIAKKYNNSKIPIEDLIAEGSFGLFEAIKKFAPKAKNKFSTYAVHWIKQKIVRYIDNTINLIRRPIYLADLYRKFLKKPKKQKKKIEKSLQWADIKMSSLQALVGVNSELLTLLGTTYPIIEEIDARLIYETLEYLIPRNKAILKDKLCGMTLKKVGKKYKLSSERIRQIEIESIEKIKTILLEKDLKV